MGAAENPAKWLECWVVNTISTEQDILIPAKQFPRIYGQMKFYGEALFRIGACPDFQKFRDHPALALHKDGTSGNFAWRPSVYPDFFLVTARGSHKGRLAERDIVTVFGVDWREKTIDAHAAENSIWPSTDSLLVAKAFSCGSRVGSWVHFHTPVSTPHAIQISYPAINERDWENFGEIVRNGARAINMIDHDLLRKGGKPNGEADSAIILGEDLEETFLFAIELLKND